MAIEKLNFHDYDICILIRGADVDTDESAKAAAHIRTLGNSRAGWSLMIDLSKAAVVVA